MKEWLKRFFLRVNWRLCVATLGWLLAEFDLGTMSEVDRRALSAACFCVIVASIASWQARIGRRVLRPEREDSADD